MAHTPTAAGRDRIYLSLAAYGALLAALTVPLLMASQFGPDALAAAILPAAAGIMLPAAFLWWLGRRLPDRWSMVFGLSWGAAVAALIGLYLVQRWYPPGQWTTFRAIVYAPLVEEFLKLLALVAVVLILTERERRRSGALSLFLAGAASGIGFAFTESLTFLAMAYQTAPQFSQDPVAALLQMAVWRLPASSLGHPLFTGLGAAVVVAGQGRRLGVRLGCMAGGFAVAAGTHSLWNLINELTHSMLALTTYGMLLLLVAASVAFRIRGTAAAKPTPAPALPQSVAQWQELDLEPAFKRRAEPAESRRPRPATRDDSASRATGSTEDRIRALVRQDRAKEALAMLDSLLDASRTPAEKATLLVWRLAVLTASPERPAAELDRASAAAWSALADHPDPRLLGRFHSSAGTALLDRGMVDEGLRHLFDADSALRGAMTPDGMADSWDELASAYSRVGLHALAMAAYRRSRHFAADPAESYSPGPLVPVRLALWRDHQGDSEGCRAVLRGVVHDMQRRLRESRAPAATLESPLYGYAVARLALLSESSEPDPAALLEAGGNGEAVRRVRQAGTACLSIAAGRHSEALAILDRVRLGDSLLGAAEAPRLSALAYEALGRFEAAYAAQREVTRLVTLEVLRIRDGLVSAAAARATGPGDRLGQVAAADLDQVTGLPGPRFLERRLDDITDSDSVLGLLHVHGMPDNPSAGLLMRRVAATVARTLRRGDLLARYSEDELAVVLHDTGLGAAQLTGRRMLRAVGNEDWASLVPETELSVHIGWAVVTPERGAAVIAAARDALHRTRHAPTG